MIVCSDGEKKAGLKRKMGNTGSLGPQDVNSVQHVVHFKYMDLCIVVHK